MLKWLKQLSYPKDSFSKELYPILGFMPNKLNFYHHFIFRFHKYYKKKGIWPSKKEAVDAWNVKRKYFFLFYLYLSLI